MNNFWHDITNYNDGFYPISVFCQDCEIPCYQFGIHPEYIVCYDEGDLHFYGKQNMKFSFTISAPDQLYDIAEIHYYREMWYILNRRGSDYTLYQVDIDINAQVVRSIKSIYKLDFGGAIMTGANQNCIYLIDNALIKIIDIDTCTVKTNLIQKYPVDYTVNENILTRHCYHLEYSISLCGDWLRIDNRNKHASLAPFFNVRNNHKFQIKYDSIDDYVYVIFNNSLFRLMVIPDEEHGEDEDEEGDQHYIATSDGPVIINSHYLKYINNPDECLNYSSDDIRVMVDIISGYESITALTDVHDIMKQIDLSKALDITIYHKTLLNHLYMQAGQKPDVYTKLWKISTTRINNDDIFYILSDWLNHHKHYMQNDSETRYILCKSDLFVECFFSRRPLQM